jgi:hypothetical protein
LKQLSQGIGNGIRIGGKNMADECIYLYKLMRIENNKEETYIVESEPFAIEDWGDARDEVEDQPNEEIVILCMLDADTRRIMNFKAIPNKLKDIEEE